MSWESVGYAALCIAVPVAWGLGVYWVSGLIERRLLRRHGSRLPPGGPDDQADALPLEYHI